MALAVTRRGAYLSPDGIAYVGMARALVEGHGYTPPPGSPPVGNFPPLFTLVLAGVGMLGPDPLTAARYVNPVAFGLLVLAVGLVARRLTGSVGLAVAAQLLVVAGADFLTYATSALSEPLFLLLSLLALAAVAACLPRRRPGLLLVAALLAAAACLTRYVGVAVLAAGAAGLALLSRPRTRAWRSAVSFAAVGVAPLLGWFAWVQSREGRATNRQAVLHPPDGEYVVDAVVNASSWVVPDWLSQPARGIVAAAVVVALVLAARRAPRHQAHAADPTRTAAPATPGDPGEAGPGEAAEPGEAAATGDPGKAADAGEAAAAGEPGAGRRPAALVALAVAAYLGALVADRFLFDVTGRLDERFLLAAHLGAILLAVWGLRRVDLSRAHAVRLGVSAIVGLQVANGALWVWDALDDPAVRPGGFTAPAWMESEVIDQVRALPEGVAVFSNQPEAVWFHTGKAAARIPEERALLTGEPNDRYQAELAAMADTLRRGGVLVYFTEPPARTVFLPTPSELERALPLQRAVSDPVAVAYVLPP